MRITTSHLRNGLDSYVLTNNNGMSVTILNYGATIAGIQVPDRDGQFANVVLGHENLDDFIGGPYYFGGTLGRFANRIAEARFTLDGREYRVTENRNGAMLHGGTVGFDKKFWKTKIDSSDDIRSLVLSLVSPDGDEGFPGNIEIKVSYTVGEANELILHYVATTDKPTVINISNHAYFNLTGSTANTVLGHVVMIKGSKYTPIDVHSIPTGEMDKVANTPLDFRNPSVVGARIDDDFDQLKKANGYDHNWVLDDWHGSVRQVATVYEPMTGRKMVVLTDQPGLQFYSGNNLNAVISSKDGMEIGCRSGLCMECQHFPNSPNEPSFPSVVLKPGEVYVQTTIYRFSVEK